jgi:transcriptional regulator with XRE-family HTH domain
MKERLSDRIKMLREKAGFTQVELADRIGISKSQFIRYETNDVQPPADKLNNLADALQTTVDYLINGGKHEKAKSTLKNSELLHLFSEIDGLPEQEQMVMIKIIAAYIRDYKTRQAYSR